MDLFTYWYWGSIITFPFITCRSFALKSKGQVFRVSPNWMILLAVVLISLIWPYYWIGLTRRFVVDEKPYF